MSGGIGFLKDAQKSFEQNRLLLKRGFPFDKLNSNTFTKPLKLKFNEVSPEELEKFKAEFRKKENYEKTKVTIITFFLFLGLAVIFFVWMF